jgi:beta-glucanase (GH16 family)
MGGAAGETAVTTGAGGLAPTAGMIGMASGSAGLTAGISGLSAGGGMAGGTNAGSGGASADGFKLLFRDDFDTLDRARWQLMTHSWDGNLALFSESTVSAQSGELRIELVPAPAGTVDPGGASKSFLGAEVRSVQTVKWGRVRARMRFARGSAVVSSLVTIYTPWPADDWNELDIECLGKDPSHTQFNAMVYTGPPVAPPASESVTPTQEPQLVDLGFDPSVDFHVYTIELTPAGARFLIDDVVRHTWTTHIDLMGLPQNVLMTIWASSSVDWAGPVSDATGQAAAVYDWLELYQFGVP